MGGRLRADHNPRRQCAVPELDPENRWHFEPPVASTQAGVGVGIGSLARGASEREESEEEGPQARLACDCERVPRCTSSCLFGSHSKDSPFFGRMYLFVPRRNLGSPAPPAAQISPGAGSRLISRG